MEVPTLKIVPVHGEPLRAHVQGYSSRCVGCSKVYSWHLRPDLVPGSQCPRCGAVLEARFHLVDLEANDGVGQCECEHWRLGIVTEVRRASREERVLAVQNPGCRWWCSHLLAFRNWRLNCSIAQHVAARVKASGGRMEVVA